MVLFFFFLVFWFLFHLLIAPPSLTCTCPLPRPFAMCHPCRFAPSAIHCPLLHCHAMWPFGVSPSCFAHCCLALALLYFVLAPSPDPSLSSPRMQHNVVLPIAFPCMRGHYVLPHLTMVCCHFFLFHTWSLLLTRSASLCAPSW